MIEFDPGPPLAFAELFAQAPDYAPYKEHFWYDWGPVFYRGRLDDSAHVLCVASDPGPTERVHRRGDPPRGAHALAAPAGRDRAGPHAARRTDAGGRDPGARAARRHGTT